MASLKVPIEVRLTDDEQREIYELCESYKDENAELKLENAELRLLVKGLIWCNGTYYNKGACDCCPINRGHVTRMGRCEHVARKLGIEVE